MIINKIKYTIAWTVLLVVCIGLFLHHGENHSDFRIENALANPNLQRGHWAIIIQDLETKESLISQNSEKNFIPASLTKLFTSAAALYILGGDYKFKTSVLADSKPDNKGVIKGTVTLKGSGDPFLTGASLKLLAEKVKEQGITRIEGSINIGGFKFDDTTLIPQAEWEDLSFYYAPEVHALSINSNAASISISPAEDSGLPAIISVEEEIPYCTVLNLTATVPPVGNNTESDIAVERGLTDNRFIISGTIPQGSASLIQKVAVHNPAEYARSIFINHLKNAGIEYVSAQPKSTRWTRSHELAFIESPPLEILIETMNKISDNLSAELLIQAASYKADKDPSPSSVQKGTAAFNHLSNILNFDNPSFMLTGGAGISRHNAVKPLHVIKLLETLHDSEFRTPFRKSLPIAGVDGTLAERFKGTFAEGNLIAKTGTLSGVSTLAGYATTKRGKNICFCLFVNHHSALSEECREDMDKLLVSLLEQL